MKSYEQAIEYLAVTYPHAFDKESKDYEDDRHDLIEAAWAIQFVYDVSYKTIMSNVELCIKQAK